MRTLIIGKGQVGITLLEVLTDYYEVEIIDKNEKATIKSEILHICFPYFKGFEEEVKKYQKQYKPKYTIIHSTVKIGTSKKCNAIHSPIIGLHPFLTKSLKTFIKFIGGEKASEVVDYFRRAGIKVYLFDKSETTELMKILDTTFYGLCIEYTKDIKRLCKKYNIPFEAWTLWTDNYNQGYQKLGFPEYTRPNLIPIMKKIGGHCVLPNCDLLKSEFTKFIKKLNGI